MTIGGGAPALPFAARSPLWGWMRSGLLVTSIVAAGFSAPGLGLAASLVVTSDQLGTGPARVTTCDVDGVTVQHVTTLMLITAVRIGGITDGSSTLGQGACDGRHVHVRLLGHGGQPIVGATGTAHIAGDTNAIDDTVTVVLLTPPAASLVGDARVELR